MHRGDSKETSPRRRCERAQIQSKHLRSFWVQSGKLFLYDYPSGGGLDTRNRQAIRRLPVLNLLLVPYVRTSSARIPRSEERNYKRLTAARTLAGPCAVEYSVSLSLVLSERALDKILFRNDDFPALAVPTM